MQAKQPRVKVRAKRTVNVANAVARSVNHTARHTAKQTRTPLRAPLYTPITQKARRQATRKVGTTKPHGRGAVVVSQHPKHPFPKQKVISHRAVVKAKRRENKRALNLSKTHPLEALKDPTHPIPTFRHSVVGEGLHRALHRQAVLMGEAQQGAASGAIPGATIQVKGNPARVGRITQNAVKDAINTPTNVAASTYLTGRALAKAATGNTKELKQLEHSLANDTFTGNLVQGNFKKAGKVLEDHPLNSALEVSGAKAVVGRSAGFTLRHGTKGMREAGSTERAPLKLYGHVEGGPTMHRQYSRDAINKGLQKVGEAVARKQGRDPNVAHGRRQTHQLHLRGNDELAATEGMRRTGRAKARKQVNTVARGDRRLKVRKKGRTGLKKHHEPAVAHMVDRVIRKPSTVKADLVKYRKKLASVGPKRLYPDQEELRQRQIAQIDKLRAAPEFLANPQHAYEAARRVIEGEAPRTEALKDTYMLSAGEEQAKYVPYAVVHMDARPAEGRVPTPRYEAHLRAKQGEAVAAKAVRRVERQLQSARRGEARAQGATKVRVSQVDRKVLTRSSKVRKAAHELARAQAALRKAKVSYRNTHGRRIEHTDPEVMKLRDQLDTIDPFDPRRPDLEAQLHASIAELENLRGVTHHGPADKALAATRDELASAHEDLVRTEQRVAQMEQQAANARPGSPQEHLYLTRRDQLQERLGSLRAARADALQATREALHRADRNRGRPVSDVEAAKARVALRLAEKQVEAARVVYKAERAKGTGTGPKGSLARLEKKRADLLAAEQALAKARDAYTYARQIRVASRVPKAERSHVPLLLDKNGKSLSVDQIKAHMKANGVEEPGFFSQRPGATGKSSFYTALVGRNMKRAANYSRVRTGRSTLEGTYEANANALEAQASHSANMAEAAKGFDRYTSEFGIKRPIKGKAGGGYWKSHDEAKHAATELGLKVGVELVPMNVGRTQKIKDLLNAGEPSADALKNLSSRVHKAFEADNQAGEFILVPKLIADKLLSSVRPRDNWERALQEYSRIFKGTVLTTSTKWLFGNIADTTVRTVMEGITPVDLARGHQVLRSLEKTDPEAAALLRERLGANFFGAQGKQETYREPNRLGRTLPGRAVSATWNGFKQVVYGANNAMESSANIAALGKFARQNVDRSFTDIKGFFKVGEDGLHQVIDGLTGTPEQVRAARFVERVYGRWGKMSPAAKRFLIYAPFAQWLGVATKYVFVTLPVHHPIKTGIIAALSNATEEERKALGFDIDPSKVAHQLEGYLQGGLPSGSKVVPLGRYTSFGILADAPTGVADFLIPQFQTALNVVGGHDFLNREIKNDDGTPLSRNQKVGLALYTLLEGSVPGVSYARRLMEGGGSTKPTSTIFAPKTFKPGNGFGDAVGKVFNPVRPLDAHFVGESQSKGRAAKVRTAPSTEPLAPSQTTIREPLAPSQTTTKEPLAP